MVDLPITPFLVDVTSYQWCAPRVWRACTLQFYSEISLPLHVCSFLIVITSTYYVNFTLKYTIISNVQNIVWDTSSSRCDIITILKVYAYLNQ